MSKYPPPYEIVPAIDLARASRSAARGLAVAMLGAPLGFVVLCVVVRAVMGWLA